MDNFYNVTLIVNNDPSVGIWSEIYQLQNVYLEDAETMQEFKEKFVDLISLTADMGCGYSVEFTPVGD